MQHQQAALPGSQASSLGNTQFKARFAQLDITADRGRHSGLMIRWPQRGVWTCGFCFRPSVRALVAKQRLPATVATSASAVPPTSGPVQRSIRGSVVVAALFSGEGCAEGQAPAGGPSGEGEAGEAGCRGGGDGEGGEGARSSGQLAGEQGEDGEVGDCDA